MLLSIDHFTFLLHLAWYYGGQTWNYKIVQTFYKDFLWFIQDNNLTIHNVEWRWLRFWCRGQFTIQHYYNVEGVLVNGNKSNPCNNSSSKNKILVCICFVACTFIIVRLKNKIFSIKHSLFKNKLEKTLVATKKTQIVYPCSFKSLHNYLIPFLSFFKKGFPNFSKFFFSLFLF
jgi:hypothetical protein